MAIDVLIRPGSGIASFTASNDGIISLNMSASIIDGENAISLIYSGSSGSLFHVQDDSSGSISGTDWVTNNISAIPVFIASQSLEVLMGDIPNDDFILSGGMTGLGTSPSFKLHVSGSIRGKKIYHFPSSYHTTQFTRKYIPFGTVEENTDIDAVESRIIAPFDGRLLKIMIRTEGDSNITGTFHVNIDDTALETTIVAVSSGTVAVLDFSTGSTEFSALNLLHFGIQPDSSIQFTEFSVVLEYDENT